MYKALLSETLPDSMVRCHICQWRCKIAPGKTGVCRMYRNEAGILYNLNYAVASSAAVDPIEKKPLYHFYPGSLVYSLGGWGCNFHCRDCQNWQISCVDIPEKGRGSIQISPEEAIKEAKSNDCSGIAWTYNEPAMWFEYTLDSAKLAKQNNLYTVYVTNGFMTAEALDTIGPYLDAWRVDIKGFSDEVYRKLAGIKHWQGILEVARRAKDKWKMHVEAVTNVVPTMNDDNTQLEDIAHWIKHELGELTPWHVTRFHPQYQLTDVAATPLATLERAVAIGHAAGLKFVYIGNVPGHPSENTACYSCGKTVVRRFGYETQVVGLNNSQCKFCGAELSFRMLDTGKSLEKD